MSSTGETRPPQTQSSSAHHSTPAVTPAAYWQLPARLAPQAEPEPRTPLNVVGRVVGVVLLTAAFWFVTFILAVISSIQSSGCFIECDPSAKNSTAGGLLALAAVATAVAPAYLGYRILRKPHSRG